MNRHPKPNKTENKKIKKEIKELGKLYKSLKTPTTYDYASLYPTILKKGGK